MTYKLRTGGFAGSKKWCIPKNGIILKQDQDKEYQYQKVMCLREDNSSTFIKEQKFTFKEDTSTHIRIRVRSIL